MNGVKKHRTRVSDIALTLSTVFFLLLSVSFSSATLAQPGNCSFQLPQQDQSPSFYAPGPYMKPEDIEGQWVGGLYDDGGFTFLKVTFACDQPRSFEEVEEGMHFVTGSHVFGRQVNFGAGEYAFQGFFADGALRGTVEHGEEICFFHLQRLYEMPEELLAEYLGAYELTHRDFINITICDEDNAVMLVDRQSATPLYATAPYSFLSTRGREVLLVRDEESNVAQVLLGKWGSTEQRGILRDHYNEQTVEFGDGTTTWTARTLEPIWDKPLPGVLIVPESDWPPFMQKIHEQMLARQGAYLLVIDEKQAISANGDVEFSSADASNAALDFLANHPRINSDYVSMLSFGESSQLAENLMNERQNLRGAVFVSPADAVMKNLLSRISKPDLPRILTVYGAEDAIARKHSLRTIPDPEVIPYESEISRLMVFEKTYRDMTLDPELNENALEFPSDYMGALWLWTYSNLFPPEPKKEQLEAKQ